MPRRKSPPRLTLDPQRRTWTIRDGTHYVRTGCRESDVAGAEKALRAYLGAKHQPQRGPAPLIADLLLVYGREHVPHKRSARKIAHTISNLMRWWGAKALSDVTARNCRLYAAGRPKVAARRDLETLRAAIAYWHREYGPLTSLPFVTLPEKPAPRERWLSRQEVARLLRAARGWPHLRRFILLGFYTGSRSGAIFGARWNWVDLATGLMRRRPRGTPESETKRTPPVRLKGSILAHMRRWARLDANPDGPIINYEGRSIGHLKRSWRRAVDVAGLPGKVTAHVLRHSRATHLMRDGARIWDAAQELGMSAMTLERTYGHHSPEYQE